uniref:Uncharacterized protein n=1 Tax=Megaselia scalaris TaxID=36166 RepID=T1H4D2_MEGSC
MLVIVKHSHRMWKLIALLFVGAFVSVVRSTRCRCQAPPQGDLTLASGCSSGDFMEEIDLYIQKECDIEDTCGRATKRFIEKPSESYDFIVVGGGSAGSIVASRLSENKKWKYNSSSALEIERYEASQLVKKPTVGSVYHGLPINFLSFS